MSRKPEFVGRNVAIADLVTGFGPGDCRHGLSDGRWGLCDLLIAIAEDVVHGGRLDLALWTAADADSTRIFDLLASDKLDMIRLFVDQSFIRRKPEVCQAFRDRWGDPAIRVWKLSREIRGVPRRRGGPARDVLGEPQPQQAD